MNKHIKFEYHFLLLLLLLRYVHTMWVRLFSLVPLVCKSN